MPNDADVTQRGEKIPPRLPVPGAIVLGAAACVLAFLVALGIWQRNRPPAVTLDVYGEVPEFAFVNERGEPVTKRTYLGTIWVVDFIFTRCGGQCPRMTRSMAELQAWLNAQKIDDVLMFSLSVDPQHDTTATLQDYALRYNYDPWRWSFGTGDTAAIYRFVRDGFKLGLEEAPPPGTAPENEPIIHSSKFVLVDRRGRIRGYFDGLDPEEMAQLRRAIVALRKEPPQP